jgi:hypothetical protein
MVALKRDKVLENSIKNASYNVTILIFVGKNTFNTKK